MQPKPAHWKELEDPIQRATARLAAIARDDTIDGGAVAMASARYGAFHNGEDIPKELDAKAIVSDVYSASTGKHHPIHEAWECPECGSVHLGQEAAVKCCGEDQLELVECEDSPDGKHNYTLDLEYDETGETKTCEHCGESEDS